ncbi:uncharacterized protein LOC135503325 [Lineus longissimus]|uniref:uncharacterized protein LOC135503325 n=1 Tax=Lineus longissimus TaxID=88925 RepID=UPI00315CBE3F
MPISSSGCNKEKALSSFETIRLKRHGKLDKKANTLADELDKKLTNLHRDLHLDSISEDTCALPEMTSAAGPEQQRLSRRHSVDVISSSVNNRRGSASSALRKLSIEDNESVGPSPQRGRENGSPARRGSDTVPPLKRGSDEVQNDPGNVESRRHLSRRSSVDVISGIEEGASRRFSLDIANLHRDNDSALSNRGRPETKHNATSGRRMSLPALYLSNAGQLVKGKDDTTRGSRKPPKRTPRSLAQLRSDPDHCEHLLRRGSGDEGKDDVTGEVDEYEAIKNCRYLRRRSSANEELSIAEIFS